LASTGAAEAVKADRCQASQVFKAFGLIEQPQPPPGQILIETRKSPLPSSAKRWVARLDHDLITLEL
jgi:hypothetical protein